MLSAVYGYFVDEQVSPKRDFCGARRKSLFPRASTNDDRESRVEAWT